MAIQQLMVWFVLLDNVSMIYAQRNSNIAAINLHLDQIQNTENNVSYKQTFQNVSHIMG